jgi:dolichol-phosphate mannosyltransferase
MKASVKGLFMSYDSHLIIVPTYNEKDNIAPLLDQVMQSYEGVHVLFVDDNSQDGTKEQIKTYQNKYASRIFLLEREGKLGLGTAYIAGFRWALERDYNYIYEMDADLSHNPVYLKDLFETHKSCDVVIGSRYVRGGGVENWGLIRRIISRGGSLYARLILGIPINDLTGGFNGWTREVLQRINIDEVKSQGYSFQIELKYRAYKAGFKLVETPIIFADRIFGTSKMSGAIVYEAMYRVIKLRQI